MRQANRFQAGSGCYTCKSCGKRTRDTGGDNTDLEMCRECYDRAGDENAVNDGQMTQAEFDAKWADGSAK